jgi:NhaA family Na+:H+ antiporter
MDQQTTPAAATAGSVPTLLRRILISIESFLRVEAAGGVTLLVATAIALLWANLSAHTYERTWEATLPANAFGAAFVLPDFIATHSLHFWVDDGLMTVFFLVVGLEIRHETRFGALSDARIATLPIVAALAGVLTPALIYLLLNTDPVVRVGWAVPTATDIAFAVGILSLVGKGIPPTLRLLLLSLAIIDDIVAIFIISSAYSQGIQLSGLAIAAAAITAVWAMQRLQIRHPAAYILPGIVLWAGMMRSGVNPTVAGVILGMMAPATAASNHLMRRLHPWVAYVIMPLFALANAGIDLHGLSGIGASHSNTLELGIILGLVLGKPLGIVLACTLAVRSGICELPPGVRWRHLVLLGFLGGIGFTMSIFIANLAFPNAALLATAKGAILIGSTVAAVFGLLAGRCIRGMRAAV